MNQLVAWYSYTALIWCLKGTMLCFFSRMTIGTWHKKMVNWVSILCGVTYLAVVLTVSANRVDLDHASEEKD